jgi:pimeloyl-ACP methyl ester carboxylesterase
MTERKTIKVLKSAVLWIFRVLFLVLSIIISLPLLLLPTATAVPIFLWLPIILSGLITLAFQFLLKPVWKGVLVSLAGVLLSVILGVISSQYYASTPAITDDSGKPLPGSIATLEKISINGSQQWVTIRGKDRTNPVLLFLAGGPGGSQLATARFALNKLEDHFVVVNWEQPGSGKSFDSVDRNTITVGRYINDAHTLVLHLKERFGQEKIYIIGESWGSALGILLVQQYPDLFHAFVGTGQMVAFTENDILCYEFALNWAKERGDNTQVEKLIMQGPPPYYDKDIAWKQAAYLLDTFQYMNSNPEIRDNGANTFRDLAAPEYGLYDKVSWFRGVLETLSVVYPQLWDIDFRKQAGKLDVPVFFLIGRHDINAPTVLTEQYFDILEAPHKEIIWFEHSGHTPWVSESDRFVEVMVETVLTHSAE